jgi:hypothetical protein
MTDQEIIDWKLKIDSMGREDMARMWRFAPAGHIVFRRDLPLSDYFQKRLESLGGFSPEISKKIGWGDNDIQDP